MFERLTIEHDKKFEDIIESRRSVRAFKSNPPEDDIIKKIISAGLIAPFAAIPAAGTKDFRKFFIIPAASKTIEQISMIVDERLQMLKESLEKEYGDHPYTNFIKLAASAKFQKIIGNAPFLIIAAERKGIPSNTSESLSYCMYNMWLRAISLKIGFCLFSLLTTLNLENDSKFCNTIKLPIGTFAINACLIGYPDDSFKVQPVNYPDYDQNIMWFKN